MDRGVCNSCRPRLVVALVIVGSLFTLFLLMVGRRVHRAFTASRSSSFMVAPADRPWPTPQVANAFDYPLQPPEAYGPYAQGITGSRAIDTRFGAQNPALGNRPNCFRDTNDNSVPFSQLYHAGVDLFAVGPTRQLLWGNAAGDPVHAVADGVVAAALNAGGEGLILITQHLLPDQSTIYAVYWHVDRLQVAPGHPVERGQVIASISDQGLNSHLHWEMRTFLDGSRLFPEGTAGARGTCNGHAAGVAYVWDDVPERTRPEFYGYLDPTAFVASRRQQVHDYDIPPGPRRLDQLSPDHLIGGHQPMMYPAAATPDITDLYPSAAEQSSHMELSKGEYRCTLQSSAPAP